MYFKQITSIDHNVSELFSVSMNHMINFAHTFFSKQDAVVNLNNINKLRGIRNKFIKIIMQIDRLAKEPKSQTLFNYFGRYLKGK